MYEKRKVIDSVYPIMCSGIVGRFAFTALRMKTRKKTFLSILLSLW